jgi:hypothetical protein
MALMHSKATWRRLGPSAVASLMPDPCGDAKNGKGQYCQSHCEPLSDYVDRATAVQGGRHQVHTRDSGDRHEDKKVPRRRVRQQTSQHAPSLGLEARGIYGLGRHQSKVDNKHRASQVSGADDRS